LYASLVWPIIVVVPISHQKMKCTRVIHKVPQRGTKLRGNHAFAKKRRLNML
jgi:hypothetical protein